jgi:hypothetical protein
MKVAEIYINRDRDRWADRVRAYKVVVDGETAGEIQRGSRAIARCASDHPIHSGEHKGHFQTLTWVTVQYPSDAA